MSRPTHRSDPLSPARGFLNGLAIAATIWLGAFLLGWGAGAALLAGHEESKRILLSGQENFTAQPRTASAR